MTEQGIAQVLTLLKAAWPDKTIEAETVTAFAAGLGDLPPQAVFNAAKRAVRTATFFPAVAEVRSLALDEALGIGPPEVAWEEVRQQLKCVGRYGIPEFTNPVTAHAVTSLGWVTICDWDIDTIGVLRSQFSKAYEAYRQQLLGRDLTETIATARERSTLPTSDRPVPGMARPVLSPTFEREWAIGYQQWAEEGEAALRARADALPMHRRASAALEALPCWRELPEQERQRLIARHAETPRLRMVGE